jgi:dephospho-CoA kinase
MRRWGLTGGIACGKSTVAALLRHWGAVVVDADVLAREVVAPGTPGLRQVVSRFGPEVLTPGGELNRKYLGTLVFRDPEARANLEAITHPLVARLREERTRLAREAGARVLVYDAALLVEKGLHRGLDELIVVSSTPENQLRRLCARDGLTEEEARARVASQMPLSQKRAAATLVLENDGTKAELEAAARAAWERLAG